MLKKLLAIPMTIVIVIGLFTILINVGVMTGFITHETNCETIYTFDNVEETIDEEVVEVEVEEDEVITIEEVIENKIKNTARKSFDENKKL